MKKINKKCKSSSQDILREQKNVVSIFFIIIYLTLLFSFCIAYTMPFVYLSIHYT